MRVRKSAERGTTKIDWLDSKHSFSFADYYDPDNMGFRSLRVINEDVVEGGGGFGTHPHRDMEILTYVLNGELEHRDSTGGGSVIKHGTIQRMTAGSGIQHSEFNHSKTEPVHLLQIWIIPERRGLEPSYEEANFKLGSGFTLLAGPKGAGAPVMIHQDAKLYAAKLSKGESQELNLNPERFAWIQVAGGTVTVNGTSVEAGDAVAIGGEKTVVLSGKADAEVLVFDLA